MKYRLEIPVIKSKILTKKGKPVTIIGDCKQTYTLSTTIDGARRTGFENDSKGDKEREKFEKDLSLQEGSLKQYSPYWDNFFIHVPSSGVILDDSNLLDSLKIKVLLADTSVAKSMSEYENAPHKYLFILRSEQLEAANKNNKREIIGKAYAILNKMSMDEKRNLLMIYGKSSQMVDAMSPETVESSVGDAMEDNYGKFIELAGDDKLKIKSLIIRYINKGIITKHNYKGTYDQDLYFETEKLGYGLEETALFLLDTKNAKIKTAIEAQYKLAIK